MRIAAIRRISLASGHSSKTAEGTSCAVAIFCNKLAKSTNEEFLEEGEKHKAEPTYQAKAAKEILELYTWWKEVYPNRPDPYDASGWHDYCEMRREKGYHLLDMEDKSEDEAKMRDTSLEQLRIMEEAYEKEDEEMMIRLIKIRQSLWT